MEKIEDLIAVWERCIPERDTTRFIQADLQVSKSSQYWTDSISSVVSKS